MSEDRSITIKLPGPLSDFYLLEGCCGSTSSARVFKALDKSNRVGVGLWISREPIDVATQLAFSQRLEALRVKAGLSDIRSFGVDREGYAFVAVSYLDGAKITSEPADMRERERRYLLCLRAVARVHSAGLVCGELCADSFLLGRTGVVRLIGVTGQLLKTSHSLSGEDEEYRFYQRFSARGEVLTVRDDVYAMLILGYRLFAGGYPSCSETERALIRSVSPDAPEWTDKVIAALLSDTAELPSSADALLHLILQSKEAQAQSKLIPAVVHSDTSIKPPSSLGAVQVILSSSPGKNNGVEKPKNRSEVLNPRSQRVVIGVCVLVFVGAFFTEWPLLIDSIRHLFVRRPVVEVEPGDVSVLALEDANHEQRRDEIKGIFLSEDPVAHDALLRRYRHANDKQEREFILEGLFNRIQRFGLVLTAEQCRPWVAKLSSDTKQEVLLDRVLRLVDPLMPLPLRVEMLQSVYGLDAAMARRLAVALALDLNRTEELYDIIAREDTRSSLNVQNRRGRSVYAIILASSELSKFFLEVAREKIGTMSDEDLVWVAKQLVSKDSPVAREVLRHLLDRQIVTGIRGQFLRELETSESLPRPVAESLLSSALVEPSRADVNHFGAWYSQSAATALLLVIMTSNDPQLVSLSFDALAVKPIAVPALASVLEVVRSTPGIDKYKAARLAAFVGLESRLSDLELTASLKGLEMSGSMQSVIGIVMKSKANRVILEVLRQYGVQLGSGIILDVLQHPDARVRIGAIEILSQSAPSVVRDLAPHLYLREQDPEVIAVYRKYLGVDAEVLK